jgi:ParB/RepB/Spo0J family partition protein
LKVKYVKVEDCEPLRELERRFYSDSSFNYLLRTIERDGFKSCYPVRAIWNEKLGKYEVFDGIHRTKVAQRLGIKKIPLIDETGKLTRQQAIAEGIKANQTHAYYSPIDKARNLQALAESLKTVRKSQSFGRPETVNLSALADLTGMSEKSISHYLQLLRLPQEVQNMVGKGKLGISHALILLRLDGTPQAHLISKLAQEVITKGMSKRELTSKVEAIKKTGRYIEDVKVCVRCKRAFTTDRISKVWLCAECNDAIHKEKLELGYPERRKVAMQRFLKVNNFVEKLRKEGKEVPLWLEARLEELHQEWREAR